MKTYRYKKSAIIGPILTLTILPITLAYLITYYFGGAITDIINPWIVFIPWLGLNIMVAIEMQGVFGIRDGYIYRTSKIGNNKIKISDIERIQFSNYRRKVTFIDSLGRKIILYHGIKDYRNLYATVVKKLIKHDKSSLIPSKLMEFCNN